MLIVILKIVAVMCFLLSGFFIYRAARRIWNLNKNKQPEYYILYSGNRHLGVVMTPAEKEEWERMKKNELQAKQKWYY